MFCSKCGFQNSLGETFCRQCGAGLENNNQQFQQSNQFIQPQQDLNNNQQNVNINTQDINNGQSIQNNELYIENADKIIKSAKGPLILSCTCIVLTFVMLFTIKMVISPWVYGISIGYTIVNLSSLKKHKQVLNDKYKSLIMLNIISIVVSIVGIVISGYLMIG